MKKTNTRVQPGVPEGGQFATTHRSEPDVDLGAASSPLTEHPFHPGLFSVADTTRVTTTEPDGYTYTDIHHDGAPDLRAGAKMAALSVQNGEGGQDEVLATLRTLATEDSPATVLAQFPSGEVTAQEGTITLTSGGELVLVAKGPTGRSGAVGEGTHLTRVESEARRHAANAQAMERFAGIGTETRYATPLAVMAGHGHAPALANLYHDHTSRLPALAPVTVEGIPVAAAGQEPPSEVAAVFVVDHPGFDGSQDGRGAVFFVTDLQPGDGSREAWGEGIVNGYTVFSPTSGMTSEHGSMYVSDLSRLGGRVHGYRPGALTFSDAMALGNHASSHEEGDIESTWQAVARACE